MSDRGSEGSKRLDPAFAAEEQDRLVDVAEMEAALDALLGKDDPADSAGRLNRIALQRAFLLLALHYHDLVPASFKDAEHLTERLTEVLELYRAGELRLPFDRASLRRDQALVSAASVLPKLRAMTADERSRAVLEMPPLWTAGAVEVLCAESLREAGLGQAEEALAWAELSLSAVTGVRRLNRMIAESTARILRPLRAAENGDDAESEEAAEAELANLRAFARAHVANAHRVAGDLCKAEATFAAMEPALDSPAEPWWSPEAEWSPEPPYDAICFALLASLRRAQRRVPEALKLLARAKERQGELIPSWTVRFNLAEAKALREIDRPHAAIDLLSRIDATTDPFLERVRHANLAECYASTGRPDEAEELLFRLGEPEGERQDMYFEWIRGRCFAVRDQHDEAVDRFRKVREAFLERSSGAYDAALVSLELSLSLAKRGSFDEVATVARESVRFFTAQGIDREAIAALAVYQHAAAAGSEGIAAIEAVYRFLRRAKGDRSVRFEPALAQF